jgi:hypothetical protein
MPNAPASSTSGWKARCWRRLCRRRRCAYLRNRPGSARLPSWSPCRLPLVHGFASITQRGNQIVSGLAINFVAAGSTVILGQAWFRRVAARRRSPKTVRGGSRCPSPMHVREVPIIGPIYSEPDLRPFAAGLCRLPAVPFTWWVLSHALRPAAARRRREPGAVDTAGISVPGCATAPCCWWHPLRPLPVPIFRMASLRAS